MNVEHEQTGVRKALTFYRFVQIDEPALLRDEILDFGLNSSLGRIGDYGYPDNPQLDRAKGYLLKGKVKNAVSNYGNFISWDFHPAGLWNNFAYLPHVGFVAGVPGHVYSSKWSSVSYNSWVEENIQVGGESIEVWVSNDAYVAWMDGVEISDESGEFEGNFAGVVYNTVDDRGDIAVEILSIEEECFIFPAKHFVTDKDTILKIIEEIRYELSERLGILRKNNKLLEAQRLEQRTNFDIEMMIELGYCAGIENYSRFFSGRAAGEKPYTLIDFFPADFLTILDESHVTLPQIQAMYNGDRARKTTLVEHGFRLPSALDNRPLKYDEFHCAQNQVIFTSATPSQRELEFCKGAIIEQVIRPTGLLDPEVDIRPSIGQIDDLIGEIRYRSSKKERVLITTLTKRSAEDLTEYLTSLSIRVRYLHSEIQTLERVHILRELRIGTFDVLVGINLLREGLDLPEVSLVAVLDADKEGFLRSKSSLLQVAGRAARNESGLVILYGDRKTEAMLHLVDTTKERRTIQKEFNKINNITPKTVYKSVDEILDSTAVANSMKGNDDALLPVFDKDQITREDKEMILDELRKAMLTAAEDLEFEKAAKIRDEIVEFEKDLGLATA